VKYGDVFLAGVPLVLSGWSNHSAKYDLQLTDLGAGRSWYIAVELATATASWNYFDAGAFPSSDADTEIIPILFISSSGGTIIDVTEYHACNIHLAGNV
jgi:hypothetical protein